MTKYVCLTSGFSILFIFSLSPISFALLNHLQKQYPPLMQVPTSITKIVVLGSGVSGHKQYPPNLSLGAASLSRLVEGVRIFKILRKKDPKTTLILSGGRVFRSPKVAGRMRNTAVMLGVERHATLLEDGSQDTHQEAIFLQRFVGKKPFILVTSAYHMPRAMALFQALDMQPIAAPTQFLGQQPKAVLRWIPSANSLIFSDIAIHEYLGLLWARLRGYIT